MRIKVKEFNYNEQTGESTMIAASKYGNISVSCKVNPLDKDIMNQWDGHRFCERKALIQYMRYRRDEMRNRFYGARDAYITLTINSLNMDRSLDYYSALLDLENQVYAYEKEWLKAREEYNEMKNGYRDFCTNWLDSRRQMQEWHEMKNKTEQEREE